MLDIFLKNTKEYAQASAPKIARFAGAAIMLAAVSAPASAARYWPAPLTEWSISLNNGLVYISSPQFAAHCSYSRGEIRVNDSVFNRSLYAYAMSAKARGKGLRYVVDDATTLCVIDGLDEF